MYLRARYYDPGTGRFLSEDPVRDGLNWYAYCAGNPVMFVDSSGLDYYVYYGKEQEFAAEQYRKQLEKDYRGVPIHMIFVDTPDTFYQSWGAMGIENGKTVNIDGVIINLHGNPFGIYANDGNMIEIGNTSNDRRIETLLLLACNAGHMDYDDNVAIQFLRQFDIGNVIAPDGTHYRYEFHGIFGLFASVNNSVAADDAFKSYLKDNKDRGSWGFVSFSLNSIGNVSIRTNVSNSMNGNKVRAVDLFKFKHTTR